MSPRRKIVCIVIGAAILLAGLLGGLAYLVPHLVNADWVKTRILARLERQADIRLSYERAEFAWFPRPRLVIREASLSVPPQAEGTVKRIEADISPLALVRNRLPIGSLLAEAPVFRVRMPEGTEGEKPPSLDVIVESASRILSGMASRAPGTTITIRGGRLALSEGDRTELTLRDIQASVSLPPDRLRFRLSCSSSFRSLVLEKAVLEGAVRLEKGNILLSVSRLETETPRLRLSGTLAAGRESPRIRMELSGEEAEIAPIRSAVLSLAGDVPGVRTALDIVRGGSLSRISARVSGNSAADLGDLRALDASALLHGGILSIPAVGLTLTEVDGSATLAKGMLYGEGVTARNGNIRAREGTLRLGLAQPDPPFHAEFLSAAEPGELRPLLRRLIQDRDFHGELDRFRDLKGSISARVILGERLSSIRPIVRATDVRLATRYDRVPFPLAIDGGQVAYEAGRVRLTGLRGRMGKSSFSGLTGSVALGENPKLIIHSGQARLAVDELVPWLSSTGPASDAFREVKSARGTVDVSSIAAEGPLGAPGDWRYESSGKVDGLVLELATLPGSLTVRRGGFHLLPEAAAFTNIEAELLDAKAGGSAEIRISGEGVSRIVASVEEGRFGPAMTEWASPRIQLPEGIAIRAPLSISGAAFSWERGGPLSFRGKIGHPDGATASISLRKTPEELAVDSLALRDAESGADMSFRLGPKELGMKFGGALHRSTVEKFVALPDHDFRRIEGSMELSVDREQPERSRARGTLKGEDIRIPWTPLDPLRIRAVSLSADGGEIRVARADLAWGELPLRASGTGRMTHEGLEADVDVETGDVQLERLMPKTPAADPGYRLPELPVRGVFRIRSESIRYDRWTVREVAAHGKLGPGRLEVAVSGADLCGFPLQGEAALDSAGLALELRAAASGKDINQSVMCLFDKRASLTGSFRFDARLTARGRDKAALLRSVEGPVEFAARDGRIYQWPMLSRILSLLNATNVIRGHFPDIRGKGLPYEDLTARGEFRAETLLVKEGTLQGPTLGLALTGEIDLRNSKMDLKALAAPFSTADWVIRKIPVVRQIMNRTLVSVPLKVKGDLYDPSVTFDSVGAGTGLLGVLERTIMLPVTIVGEVLPETTPSE